MAFVFLTKDFLSKFSHKRESLSVYFLFPLKKVSIFLIEKEKAESHQNRLSSRTFMITFCN